MRDYESFLLQVERVIHQYNQGEMKTKTYGLEIPLSQTEIHMIAVIGEQPGIGVKRLAQIKGVTSGAASQMIKKLIQKGLVKKQVSAESEAKIELSLTQDGFICFNTYKKQHKEANEKWYELFNQLDDNTYNAMTKLVDAMENKLKV